MRVHPYHFLRNAMPHNTRLISDLKTLIEALADILSFPFTFLAVNNFVIYGLRISS